MNPSTATWIVCAAATLGVLLRPRGWPEAVWAVSGAALLVAFGLLPAHAARASLARSLDVLLFLAGMMLLAETARAAGLFATLAAHAARAAGGRRFALFALVYALGIAVTALLSNDATAVVLTPAVLAAARAAGMPAVPLAFACAFVSNAASFLLPISNPANLVVYGAALPALLPWLARFLLPATAAILVTFAVLAVWFRRDLSGPIAPQAQAPNLSRDGAFALAGLAAGAAVMLACSLAGRNLGLPTALSGAATALLAGHRRLGPILRGISWQVLPLVAGLFLLADALEPTGATQALAHLLRALPGWASGAATGFACNFLNNLPAGLLIAAAATAAHAPAALRAQLLIGIDLGPNLSVTGSLATILWLTALRREGIGVSAWQFLRVGAVAMPAALAVALLR